MLIQGCQGRRATTPVDRPTNLAKTNNFASCIKIQQFQGARRKSYHFKATEESVHTNHQATQCIFGVQQIVGRTLTVTDAVFYYRIQCLLLNRHYLTSRMLFYPRWLWSPSTSLPEPQISQKRLVISSQQQLQKLCTYEKICNSLMVKMLN
jgi:hypothetical protein